MKTFQIWGNFPRGDREHITTASLFAKGQLMADEETSLEQFERDFAESEDEDFVLMREFESETFEVANEICRAYLDGWHNVIHKEKHGDRSQNGS